MVHIHAEGPAFFTWLPKMFGKRVIVTVHGIDWQRDDDQRIDTILDVDNQRQSLKDLAEKYTSIRRKDYLEWEIRLEHEMTKAEKNERGRTV